MRLSLSSLKSSSVLIESKVHRLSILQGPTAVSLAVGPYKIRGEGTDNE